MSVLFKHKILLIVAVLSIDIRLAHAQFDNNDESHIRQISEYGYSIYPGFAGEKDYIETSTPLYEDVKPDYVLNDVQLGKPFTLLARITSPIDFDTDKLVVIGERDEKLKKLEVGNPDEDSPTYIWQLSDEGPDAFPRMAGETDLIVEYASLFDADDPEYEYEDWLLNIPTSLIARFSESVNLKSDLLVVLDSQDIDVGYEGDYPYEGIYVKVLKLQYERESFRVFAGRYDPTENIFGYAPIFFGNYNTNIDLYGRVGMGISASLTNKDYGRHTLSAHKFYLDTSRLSGEITHIRGKNELSDGEAGNTEKFNNYLVTLNGGSPDSAARFEYSLGIGKQLGYLDGVKDEHIAFTSLVGIFKTENDAEVEISVDLLSLRNVDGSNDDSGSITLGFGYSDWPYYIGTAHSRRVIKSGVDSTPNRSDIIMEVVCRYGIGDSSFLEGAYQWLREDDSAENSIGLAYITSFDWLVH